MPDEDQPWYFAPFMAVSAETFVMADFIALSGPEIRRDVSRSDKLDIFFIDRVWVSLPTAEGNRARLPGRPGRIMSRLCRRIHVRCLVIRMAPDGVLEIASPFARDCDKSEYYNEKARAEEPFAGQDSRISRRTCTPGRPTPLRACEAGSRPSGSGVRARPCRPYSPARWHSKRKTT